MATLLTSGVMANDTNYKSPALRGPVQLSHLILRQFLHDGDFAVDATCGNGNDTLLLAELVGSNGKVIAFDIQQEAISRTTDNLAAAGLLDRVTLILAGHQTIRNKISEPLQAVVFNLGYLPGGEHSICTKPETTIAALEQSIELLAPGGIIALTIYPGHDDGKPEQQQIEIWLSRLKPQVFHIWRMQQVNVKPGAPFFVMLQKGKK